MPSSGSMLRPTYLHDASGGIVALVAVPDYDPPSDILLWGSRYFVRRAGKYIEARAHNVCNTLAKGDK